MKDLGQQMVEGLAGIIGRRFAWEARTDHKGVLSAWCRLDDKDDLAAVAGLLKRRQARLSSVTAYAPEKSRRTGHHEIAYHFDLDGDTLTVVVHVLPEGEVDSLTPIFRNADWHEREMMEFYGIRLRGHPDPRRLFLDESLATAVLDKLIPYSTLVNVASTKDLWERILAKREEKP